LEKAVDPCNISPAILKNYFIMLKEFREFALRGNVIDLAIGVIIGAAFGKIIASLVNDVIMPLLNPVMPGGDWRTMEIGPGVKIGAFLGTVLDFVIVALVIFMLVKIINSAKRKEEDKPAPAAELPPDIKLLAEIRDILSKRSV
jgi:large conductance mechanosensitive channel